MYDRKFLSPLVPEPFGEGRLLDVCSGTGRVATYAANSGWSVVAIDSSQAMLEQVASASVECHLSDCATLPFPSAEFDLVTCRQGLQYLPLEQSLAEIKRVARSEVRLGHITLEAADDGCRWEEYFSLASPGRRHVFAPGDVAEYCERAGLRVRECAVHHSSSKLLAPVAHLTREEQERLVDWVRAAPSAWRAKYGFVERGCGEYEYSQRWEFICCTAG